VTLQATSYNTISSPGLLGPKHCGENRGESNEENEMLKSPYSFIPGITENFENVT
jgi:hypothetical protein